VGLNKGVFMETYEVMVGEQVKLDFDEYQKQAVATATYPELGDNLVYPALGLAGEAGEVAEKIKKLWRNRGIKSSVGLDNESRNAILKEMGDVMWYIAALCAELDESMLHVAGMNLEKLHDRRARGVIKSEGDSR
jgi:NTP pyrophosphatase (non-canonical NTP hydrolase)